MKLPTKYVDTIKSPKVLFPKVISLYTFKISPQFRRNCRFSALATWVPSSALFSEKQTCLLYKLVLSFSLIGCESTMRLHIAFRKCVRLKSITNPTVLGGFVKLKLDIILDNPFCNNANYSSLIFH